MKTKLNSRWIFSHFLNVRGLIFAVCLGNFIVRGVVVDRLDREMRAYGYVEHWYPGLMMVEPLLLLVSGVLLLFNRWWSFLLALLASGRVIYSLGYLSWTAVHNAHDVPMLSWQAMEKLWYVIYQPRPEYLFEVVLGVVVFICAVVLLARVKLFESAMTVAGG
jgi:hypothetical protein